MEDVKHHIIGKGLARGATSLMETLYDAFGETIVLVAVLSVLIIPCTWKVLTAKREDGDGTDIVDTFIHGFLFFASFGIASRAAYWFISREGVPFLLIILAFIVSFVASCAL